MLKHATINRTSKAQQALQLQRQWSLSHSSQRQASSDSPDPEAAGCINDNASSIGEFSLNQSPSPQPLSAPELSSLTRSPSQGYRRADFGRTHAPPSARARESMIRVFAQSLSQDVEYITMHVNAQTKSQQIIKSLLRKFRLKHRDPNLFYLTLERWIRKDGLKFKSVMLLGDEACPLQLQQCCSNPPHNDIKFTLQQRTGALVKIYCSDVAPDAQYKCLSLSTQTTVEETIELMLHMLNLSGPSSRVPACSSAVADAHHPPRLAGSPSSTGSSTNSSSSGIESDPTAILPLSLMSRHEQNLDSDSRASSVTSISSTSNLSNTSIGVELYSLVIECRDTSHQRILESDEYLVDVYQSLLAEATKEQQSNDLHLPSTPTIPIETKFISSSTSNSCPSSPSKQKLDQWFLIKLKRRESCVGNAANFIKFTNPRQNTPLPPIPLLLSTQFSTNSTIGNNVNGLQSIVSTAQIEVGSRAGYPSHSPINRQLVYDSNSAAPSASSKASGNNFGHSDASANTFDTVDGIGSDSTKSTASTSIDKNNNNGDSDRMPPPPAIISLWLPPVRPRRRNLSNASTTFAPPQRVATADVNNQNGSTDLAGTLNRRRYDPARLAEDLSKLDVVCDNKLQSHASIVASPRNTTRLAPLATME